MVEPLRPRPGFNPLAINFAGKRVVTGIIGALNNPKPKALLACGPHQ
jgi:hypothetical protein